MQKNSLLKKDKSIIRILDIKNEKIFTIDCVKRTMPRWINQSELNGYSCCTEEELLEYTQMSIEDIEALSAERRKFVYEHYSLIAGILPFVTDEQQRSYVISKISEDRKISKQTIRFYLCLFLAYQDISVFAPKQAISNKPLTTDEKNMRWALNKFFYNKNKNSLNTAYIQMLKEKYCDASGVLLPPYPSFYQFRYFYRKHKNMQTFYISRDGIKDYQRNNRPLVGDGVQEFAPMVGVGMLDATVCDIYLVNDAGNLVGRPILTACIDAYSSLCCGYSLLWEGGVYSLRNLMVNIVTDKVEWCAKFGIYIDLDDWDCKQLPAILVTDMGNEYTSETFEQISELGIIVINLPAYRPELKGSVEKFFDLVQEAYKKHLKGKGVVEPDYQERGSHDYKKDACLTLVDFEKIILRCIIYYNSQRVIENYPYTEEMLLARIKPYANCIWEWGKQQTGANLISADMKQLIFALLPRTIGRFSRFGLKVNKMRYHCEGYTEQYLKGGTVTVAYNPDDVNYVWVIEDGVYIEFTLIESRYKGKSLENVKNMQSCQKAIIKETVSENLQAQIYLAEHINIIAQSICGHNNLQIKDIRDTRKREQSKTHKDYLKEGGINDSDYRDC